MGGLVVFKIIFFICHFRTLAAISGKDFVVVATDTRMSQQDVNIVTRDIEKIHIL